MEDTHWAYKEMKKKQGKASLNPCFNGRYSLRIDITDMGKNDAES